MPSSTAHGGGSVAHTFVLGSTSPPEARCQAARSAAISRITLPGHAASSRSRAFSAVRQDSQPARAALYATARLFQVVESWPRRTIIVSRSVSGCQRSRSMAALCRRTDDQRPSNRPRSCSLRCSSTSGLVRTCAIIHQSERLVHRSSSSEAISSNGLSRPARLNSLRSLRRAV
ncbi:hypothetical protein AB0392_02875 [Nonomuraea angiospora]|uniref:hypothetical protein n=1 Tax=Nonomuraea angiospora TaxID=46172 RepID=UPI00344F4906